MCRCQSTSNPTGGLAEVGWHLVLGVSWGVISSDFFQAALPLMHYRPYPRGKGSCYFIGSPSKNWSTSMPSMIIYVNDGKGNCLSQDGIMLGWWIMRYDVFAEYCVFFFKTFKYLPSEVVNFECFNSCGLDKKNEGKCMCFKRRLGTDMRRDFFYGAICSIPSGKLT